MFAVCWTPFSVYGYLVFFGVVGGDPIRAGNEYWTAVQYTVHVIAFMNSTINPITYLFTYDFLSKICKPCKPKNRIPRTKATSEVSKSSTHTEESIAMNETHHTSRLK